MGKIAILPEFVANQIAAGEVVERPASVVKELVDNALDAGADEIEVILESGGIDRIEVRDNGEGMSLDDLKMSVARHGTSKIKTIEDLQRIVSMGFRGEALASISSVSKLTLRSKREEDTTGNQIEVSNGKVGESTIVGMPRGTVIIVKELFESVPARKKFLKTPATELRQIIRLINHLSLAWPQIEFKLINNGREMLNYNKRVNLEDRVIDVIGKEIASQSFKGIYDHAHWKIEGQVGKPQTGSEKGSEQFLIVNKRPVSDRMVMGAVKNAMGSLLPPRYQVPWVMWITMPAEMVDVNVHPRKEEVKFVNSQSVYSAIVAMINTAIGKQDMTFVRGETLTPAFNNQNSESSNLDSVDKVIHGNSGWENKSYESKQSSKISGFGENYSNQTVSTFPKAGFDRNLGLKDFVDQVLPWEAIKEEKDILQIKNLYLIYEEDDGMVLVDQHAAHERIRIEQLMDQYEEVKLLGNQKLLIPVEIKLNKSELLVISDSLGIWKGLGFEIGINQNEIEIKGIPVNLVGENLEKAFREVIGDLGNEDLVRNLPDNKMKIITYLSCRTAIKAGAKLTMIQRRELINQLEQCKRPYTCPHGRPVSIKLRWGEMEKMFLRIGM